MDGVLSLVESTNALPLSTFTGLYLPETHRFLQYTHPETLTPYTISLQSSSSILSEDLSACFDLIASTSASSYAASSLGWHPRSKRKEMQLPDLRYLLVQPNPPLPLQGFLSFMVTYEDGKEVIYVYEVHLAESLRGGGLGKQLMGIVEEVGRKVGVEKAMLTVFVANEGARKFYGALGYGIDEYSPEERKLRGGVVKKPDYVILSKRLR
ncbi:hypothetical protein MMC19_006297 [Ptychographa xylographoides]|nr:hypothetical protein [Ptychographa xylographoides]